MKTGKSTSNGILMQEGHILRNINSLYIYIFNKFLFMTSVLILIGQTMYVRIYGALFIKKRPSFLSIFIFEIKCLKKV